MLKHELEFLAEPIRVLFLYDFPFLEGKEGEEKDINRYLAYTLYKEKIVNLESESFNSLYKDINKQLNREKLTTSPLSGEAYAKLLPKTEYFLFKNFEISVLDKFFFVKVKYFKFLAEVENQDERMSLDDINARIYQMIHKRVDYMVRLVTVRDADLIEKLKNRMIDEEKTFFDNIRKEFATLINSIYYNTVPESSTPKTERVPITDKGLFSIHDSRMYYNFKLSDGTTVSSAPITLFRFDFRKETFYLKCENVDEAIYIAEENAQEYLNWHLGLMGSFIQSVQISDEYKQNNIKADKLKPKYFS